MASHFHLGSDRRHNALTGNVLEADCILLRMNERKVTNVDRNAEGILVTFADGYTFLFQSDFLYMARLKDGQLVGQDKSGDGNGKAIFVEDPIVIDTFQVVPRCSKCGSDQLHMPDNVLSNGDLTDDSLLTCGDCGAVFTYAQIVKPVKRERQTIS